MNKYMKKLKEKSFSEQDILDLVETKIITYPELLRYKNIDNAMHENGTLVILYLFKPTYGHWICLIKRDEKTIEHFDSYANMKPDDELNWINKDFRKSNREWYPYLTKLLWESGYNIEYNDYKLQSKKNDIRTCGRWVAARILLRDLDIDEFIKCFTSNMKYDPDSIVAMITSIKKER